MIAREDTLYRVTGFRKEQISYVEQHIDEFYYEKKEKKRDQFGRPRIGNDGKPELRTLHPSKGMLKEIQKIINNRILSRIDFPPIVHGSVKKRSCITNAKTHQGNKYFFLTDLRGFFPSIHFRVVYDEFIRRGFSPCVASHLTRLVTYNKCVPQGAPTSPTIANMVFGPQDEQLIEISNKYGLTYTRYIDDLTFSSKKFIEAQVIQELLYVIRKSPFKYHHKKTKTSIGKTQVTGVKVLNNYLNAPNSKFEKLAKLDPDTNSAKGLAVFIKEIRRA